MLENRVPFDVFVVEMWVIRPMIKVAPQEENGGESVIIQAISRKCAKLNRGHQMGGGKAARIAV